MHNPELSDYPLQIREHQNAWLFKPMYRKVKWENQHLPFVIVGKPGSGKSYLSLYLAWLLYPKFKPSESIVFNASDFANIVAKEKLPKGFPIIIDDSGITAGSSDAVTKEVKAISKIMQSVRSRNLIIILNLPHFFLLAKNVRTLLEYYLEPVKLNREQKICHAKFRILKISPLTGDVYRYSPIKNFPVQHWTGYKQTKKMKITTLAFPMVPQEIADEYEELKRKKMHEFNVRQAKSLTVTDKFELSNRLKDMILKDAGMYVDLSGKYMNVQRIMQKFGVTKSDVYKALELAGIESKLVGGKKAFIAPNLFDLKQKMEKEKTEMPGVDIEKSNAVFEEIKQKMQRQNTGESINNSNEQ